MRKDEASIFALWLESVLYGVYTVLFFTCIYILCYLRDPRSTSKTVLSAVVVMYGVATAHVAIVLRRALLAFIYSHLDGGSEAFYNEVSHPLNVAQQSLFIVNGIIADCLLIFRCYIVWSGQLWVCALPVTLLMLSSGAGIYFTREYALVPPGGSAWQPNIQRWITTFTATSLATNLLVTVLIASRIWWVTTRSSRILGRDTSSGKYNVAIFGVIESGALYCVPVTVFLIIYETRSSALPILCQILTQIAGIAPTLIVVQAGLGLTVDKTHSTGSTRTVVDPPIPLHALQFPFPVLSITKTQSPRSPQRLSFGANGVLERPSSVFKPTQYP
ncbi:hypothetical protein AURDEDRAFT_183566 [Auricularia subglabra TFB-10046 SS5]|nr:hypothetical protein AURDEDRAFT_183566 [Auricularia subglabra TFB-10046 SS5]